MRSTLPIAIVFPSSRSVKRPSCGTSLNFSKQHEYSVRILTCAMDPLLRKSAFPFFGCFVFGSISETMPITSHSHTMVWMCSTALYPAVKMDLCSCSSSTESSASKSVDTTMGFSGEHSTNPACTASSSTPSTLIKTFSPGRARAMSALSVFIPITFTCCLVGMTVSLSPTVTVPDSVLPMITMPISRKRSMIGRRKGASGLRSCGSRLSRIWKKDGPEYHEHMSFGTTSLTLYPCRPEMGTK
mmetsp:Transcript_23972/g.81774  ORF Transcript_23972/g.81774 Transcript_23972/m.81774 type:complete len:243 (-) Transcript_23972:1223-1951(-)